MSVGEWGLELVPNAPDSARNAFDWGHLLYVTPTQFDRSVSFATLKSASVYAGLVFRIGGGRRRFGGPGILGYLQTGKGEAGINTYTARGPSTFATLLAAWMATTSHDSNGLDRGTAYSATATTVSFNAGTNSPPLKSAMDTAAAATGNEYRARPDGLVDYGVSTSLFRSTPTVAVAPGFKGADAVLRVLETTAWDVERNIDNYRNRAWVLSQDETYLNTVSTSSPAGAVSFSTFTGNAAYFTTAMTALDTDVHAEVDAIGQAMADQYVVPAMEIDCSVREYCIPRFVTPGDWIWVYSVDDGLTDTANQVVFNGQTLFPKKVRCVGYSWPLEAGMGVYTYDTTGGTVTDVSDYVQWETGKDTTLELDSKPQSILDAGVRSVLL